MMAAKNSDITAKLSKKVAELTVVVHMLFKRNHEKEVEYESFKILNDHERNRKEEDFQSKIAWLENQLEEQESYRTKLEYKLGDLDSLQQKIDSEEELKVELREQISLKDESLRVANVEIEVLKEKLESCSEELDSLIKRNKYLEEQIEAKSSNENSHKMQNTPEENPSLLEKIESLEDHIKELHIEHDDEMTKMHAENIMMREKIQNYDSALSEEINQLRKTLNGLSAKQSGDQKKITDLELETKELKQNLKLSDEEKKILHRKSLMYKEQLRIALKSKNNPKSDVFFKDTFSQKRNQQDIFETRDEELERLKREIQFYRMELQNREGNFNRMFADQQPVHVEARADQQLVERNLTGIRKEKRNHLPKLTDRRSMTFIGRMGRSTLL